MKCLLSLALIVSVHGVYHGRVPRRLSLPPEEIELQNHNYPLAQPLILSEEPFLRHTMDREREMELRELLMEWSSDEGEEKAIEMDIGMGNQGEVPSDPLEYPANIPVHSFKMESPYLHSPKKGRKRILKTPFNSPIVSKRKNIEIPWSDKESSALIVRVLDTSDSLSDMAQELSREFKHLRQTGELENEFHYLTGVTVNHVRYLRSMYEMTEEEMKECSDEELVQIQNAVEEWYHLLNRLKAMV
jgi:hypothetical protein